jgi:eukaryotic-like serine/threonine-protein kinase
MSERKHSSTADRNLLFGILAVQLNFIDRDALVAAMNAWVLEKHKPLGHILLENQKLTAEQLQAINTLIEQHLKLHDNNPELSLLSTKVVLADLLLTEDDDVRASIAKLAPVATDSETVTHRPSSSDDERYRKLRHHADGGQGRVFVAEDAELHREVALKEIKGEYADDSDRRSRLVLEAEITGGLEHPGIVPIYGLGTYPDGRPYYAMRFIRGDNLDTTFKEFHAVDKPGRDVGERSLAFRQLLRRFVDVCNAVAYAHSRGVVHRDLKPKNVMIGKFGETLVVDWGLAKFGVKNPGSERLAGVADPERTLRPASGTSVDLTLEGVQVGTPPYMSPEQAAGRILELGPASDIYSLGSLLYVLLTGKLPFSAATKEEILAKVQRGRFTPPKQVKPAIPAALDAICCKAMSLHPNDRYQSALELAAEIEHWLGDEAVAAYREPWIVRAGRWARRHRTAVASAGVFVLCASIALAISTAFISAEQRRTEEQRRRAVENYQISREQSFNIIKLIESSEPEFARVPLLHERRADLLKTASDACREFLQQEPNDVELIRRSASIYRYAANFHRLIYEHDQAMLPYQDAIALRRRLTNEFAEADQQFQLCDVLRDLASSQKDQGRLQDATHSLEEALGIAESLWKSEPGRPSYRRGLALLLMNRALLQARRTDSGASRPALAQLQRAIDLFRGLVEGPAAERHPYESLLLAAALNQRAIQERESANLDGALKSHAEAVKLLKDLFDAKLKDVNEADATHFRAECQLEQCLTWAKIGNPKYLTSAEANAGLAVNKLFELARSYPRLPAYRESLAKAFRVRGQIRLQGKNFPGAREHFKSAKELLDALVQQYSSLPSLRGELGATLTGLGEVAKQIKDDDATKWFELAEAEVNAARKRSPDDIQWQRLWNELKRARQPQPETQGAAGSEM